MASTDENCPSKSITAENERHLRPFCSHDLDLDPMTFVYKPIFLSTFLQVLPDIW